MRCTFTSLSSNGAYLGNSSKCISGRFVIPNPLRAWPLRALRLGEKPSFGGPSLLPGDLCSHRKGAKDAKGDSHASNSKRVIDCKKSVSSRFHIVLEPTLAKMQEDSHCDKPPASKASGRWLRRMQAIQPHR